ncbi:MAG: hypothetical protein NT033_05505 [Candidatus Omnitrophica bacterium]|nr:hypothetical protein [Candidatus Omnitrophota bacterium]
MHKKEKITYEIDPFNRIILPRFRTVLDGEFQINKHNLLTYRVKKPSSSPVQQLKLSGNWSLNKDHNLVLTLDKINNQREGDKLTLEGEIIDVTGNELVFSLSTGDSREGAHFYLIRLGGKWQADQYNRLGFLVTKETGSLDELTFSGTWEINRKNQLVYTYTKTGLKTKNKLTRSITFKGFWDINERNRVSYILNKSINSGFEFRVGLGKPLKSGLQYELGFGAKGVRRKFFLFGSWKINERLGLIFEIPTEKGKLQNIVFGATCKLDNGYNLELELKNNRQEDLSIKAKLSRTFWQGLGQEYIEALKEGREISLLAGMGFRW